MTIIKFITCSEIRKRRDILINKLDQNTNSM